MRIKILLLFLIILSCSENKNDYEKYNELEQKAMLEFADEKYEKALSDFEIAINLKPKEDVSMYFYATASALNIGKLEKAKKLLIASIHNTNASIDYFLNFDKFNEFRNEKLFSEIENNYDKHISTFYNNLEHPEIYREIDSLVEVDQKYRTNGSQWNEISRIDSLNINRLIEITKEHGWQKRAWLVLWHQRGTYGQEIMSGIFLNHILIRRFKKEKSKKIFG